MPRGVPKAGKRAPGGGRPPKYNEPTKMARVPESLYGRLDEILLFLAELDAEIEAWEQELAGKDLKTNPRYSKAKILVSSIREKIDALGIVAPTGDV